MSQLLQHIITISEFAEATNKMIKHGTCTWASAAMCYALQNQAFTGRQWNKQMVVDLMMSMSEASYHRGEAAQNGSATIAQVAHELDLRGAAFHKEPVCPTGVFTYPGYPIPGWIEPVLRRYAGIYPMVLQVLHAHNINDVAGQAEDPGVDCHAIAVLGYDSAKSAFIVADPNKHVGTEALDYYSWPELVQADPSGVIVLDMPAQPAQGVTPMSANDNGKIISFTETPFIFKGGFADAYRQHGALIGLPEENEHGDATQAYQVCQYVQLEWHTGQAVKINPLGPLYLAMKRERDAQDGQIQNAQIGTAISAADQQDLATFRQYRALLDAMLQRPGQ